MPNTLHPSHTRQLVGLGIFVVVLIGAVVSFILVQRNQDTRQQASTDGTISTLIVRPNSGTTLPLNSQSEVQLYVQVPSGKNITGIQYIAEITGAPSNITFTPGQIPGMNVAVNTLDNSGSGKKLTLLMTTQLPQFFTTTGSDLLIGTLKFTPSSAGTLRISPDTSLTKVVEYGTNSNLITSAPFVEYEYGTITNPTNTPVSTPTVSAPPTGNSVISKVTLYNVQTDQPAQVLSDGAVVNIGRLGAYLTAVAETSQSVGSLKFELTGATSTSITESVAPYSMSGDDAGQFHHFEFNLGQHSLKITPYSGAGATGTMMNPLTINFTTSLTDATPAPTSTPTFTPTPRPTPTPTWTPKPTPTPTWTPKPTPVWTVSPFSPTPQPTNTATPKPATPTPTPTKAPISTTIPSTGCGTDVCRADINQDGILDAQDYSILMNIIRENFFAQTNACWSTNTTSSTELNRTVVEPITY